MYICSIRSPYELLSTLRPELTAAMIRTYPGAREENLKKHVIVPVLWLEWFPSV